MHREHRQDEEKDDRAVLETLAAEEVDWTDLEQLAARDLLDRLLAQLKPQVLYVKPHDLMHSSAAGR